MKENAKLPEEVMRDIGAHIASYGPTISHYRRAHAPNRLYLCPELSKPEMHKNFVEGGGKCGIIRIENS